ncbi:MAG: methyltransferase domain-containing protein [Marinobacterium sp.]|nr:methyltransferase domain-containing protein [Marinobacterium sp.]
MSDFLPETSEHTSHHYSHALNEALIINRIREHYPDGPDLYQLAPIDQLHTGGIKASEKLLAHLSPGLKVLDIGAGLGGVMRLIMERSGCTVTGLDLTHPFNRLNHQLGQTRQPANTMRVTTADGQHLPFADKSFDCILYQHSLVNMPDKVQALQEARRVLNAGGRVILHELLQGPNWHQLNYPVPWASAASNSHLMIESELLNLLAQAGFTDIQFNDWSDEARQWRQRQSKKENVQQSQQKKSSMQPPLSPALVLGPDFSLMGRNIMQGLQDDAVRVIELSAKSH